VPFCACVFTETIKGSKHVVPYIKFKFPPEATAEYEQLLGTSTHLSGICQLNSMQSAHAT
jgi:hypothetical protein